MRRHVPTGLLGAVFLVVTAESLLNVHTDSPRDWMSLTWRQADRASRGPEARADVLCLGDSLVKEGFLPRVFEARCGRSAYNLAFHGGPAPASYFMLRRVLDRGLKPAAILVDFHPNLMAASPRSSVPYWSELLRLGELLDLGWTTGDTRLVFQTIALAVLPSVRSREAIREAIFAAVQDRENPGRSLNQALARNFGQNLGARVSPVTPPPANPEALLWGLPDHGHWKPNLANLLYMHRFFALAQKAGVRVVWLWPPTSPTWQARRAQIGADGDYERIARAMQATYPGLIVVDGRTAGYAASAFHDLTHLHVEGASEFTAALADWLAPVLAGKPANPGAWVSLARYRADAPVRLAEDVEQSRIALIRDNSVLR
jgi:hypothetical protein